MVTPKQEQTSGVVRSIPIVGDVDRFLAGESDQFLTLLLIGLALAGIGVALWAPPVAKAALAAYWLLP